jgi:hypothetical protein
LTGEDIVKTLDRAAQLKLKDGILNFKDKFIVAPQVKEGISVWAKWIENKYLKNYHVMWAFQDIKPKKWLALRIEIPFKDFKSTENLNLFYFNLQNLEDRSRLKKLEREFLQYLKEKGK